LRKKIVDSLRPGRSWWALVGIVLFFVLPEIAAFFYGDEIKGYFHYLSQKEPDRFLAKSFEMFESFGDFSWINLLIGLGFVGWFFYERYKKDGP